MGTKHTPPTPDTYVERDFRRGRLVAVPIGARGPFDLTHAPCNHCALTTVGNEGAWDTECSERAKKEKGWLCDRNSSDIDPDGTLGTPYSAVWMELADLAIARLTGEMPDYTAKNAALIAAQREPQVKD